MRPLLVDLGLALLALCVMLVPGSMAGWHLAQRGPGEVVEVEREYMAHHIGAPGTPLGVGLVGQRTQGQERMQWHDIRLDQAREVALLTTRHLSWSQYAVVQPGLITLSQGTTTLRVEVRP